MENTCIMLTTPFYTPVDLRCIFEDVDLYGEGVVVDSHITLLYAKELEIPKEEILESIVTILGDDFDEFEEMLKRNEKFSVMDLFELDRFEGKESDYVVLKMKKSGIGWSHIEIMNKALSRKYDVKSDFSEYNPHITLAQVLPGQSKKYLESEKLRLILADSKISVDDIIVSYGGPKAEDPWKQYHVTNYHALDRFFKIQDDSKNKLY